MSSGVIMFYVFLYKSSEIRCFLPLLIPFFPYSRTKSFLCALLCRRLDLIPLDVLIMLCLFNT